MNNQRVVVTVEPGEHIGFFLCLVLGTLYEMKRNIMHPDVGIWGLGRPNIRDQLARLPNTPPALLCALYGADELSYLKEYKPDEFSHVVDGLIAELEDVLQHIAPSVWSMAIDTVVATDNAISPSPHADLAGTMPQSSLLQRSDDALETKDVAGSHGPPDVDNLGAVRLEFQLDETVLADDQRAELQPLDASGLYCAYFRMPVTLSVSDVPLFALSSEEGAEQGAGSDAMESEGPSSMWPSVPLLHVATVGLDAVKRAKLLGTSTYYVPELGQLRFTVQGPFMAIHSTIVQQTVRAPYDEVLNAFASFARRTRELLGERVVNVRQHWYWGPWFRQEVTNPWELMKL